MSGIVNIHLTRAPAVVAMSQAPVAWDNDQEGFRRAMEDAGFLARGAPCHGHDVEHWLCVSTTPSAERWPRTLTGAIASTHYTPPPPR